MDTFLTYLTTGLEWVAGILLTGLLGFIFLLIVSMAVVDLIGH